MLILWKTTFFALLVTYLVQSDSEIHLHFHLDQDDVVEAIDQNKTDTNYGSDYHAEAHYECQCGIENEEPNINMNRISGGTTTKPNQYPWMAKLDISFQNDKGQDVVSHCGGSLISNKHILTAYHCVDIIRDKFGNNWDKSHLGPVVKLGAHNRHDSPQVYKIATSKRPPNLTPSKTHGKRNIQFDHDIAILVLDKTVTFGPNVLPVCLPSSGSFSKYIGKWGTAKGWGYVDKEEMSDHLKHVQVQIVDKPVGGGRNGHYFFATGVDVIGGVPQDPCAGDSGGPLVVKESNKWVIVGTVSGAGYNCKTERGHDKVGIWNKVPAHLDWIKEVLDEDHATVCRA